MRKPAFFLLALITSLASSTAQQDRARQTDPAQPSAPATQRGSEQRPPTTPAPRVRARNVRPPSATPPPAGAPAAATPEKKPGFLKRVFGRKPKATPAPEATPAATPASTPRPRSRQRTKPTSAEPTEASDRPTGSRPPAPAPAGDEADATAEKPSTPPAATPPGKKGTRAKKGAEPTGDQPPEPEKTAEQRAVEEAMAGGDADAIEKAKYDEVRVRALEDPRVKELKVKADEALTDDEGRKALRAYNKALFQKMRSLDGSIKDRVDRMEAAVMKRLEGSGE